MALIPIKIKDLPRVKTMSKDDDIVIDQAVGTKVINAGEMIKSLNIKTGTDADFSSKSVFFEVRSPTSTLAIPGTEKVYSVPALYVASARQGLNYGYTYSPTTSTITLAERITQEDIDNTEDGFILVEAVCVTVEGADITSLTSILASSGGATHVGTSFGITVEEKLKDLDSKVADGSDTFAVAYNNGAPIVAGIGSFIVPYPAKAVKTLTMSGSTQYDGINYDYNPSNYTVTLRDGILSEGGEVVIFHISLKSIDGLLQNAIKGFSFAAGGTLQSVNDQIYDAETQSWYFWLGTYPKNIPPTTKPIGSGWRKVGISLFNQAGSFSEGGFVISKRDCFFDSRDGYWYYYKGDLSFSHTVLPNSSPGEDWQCVGMLNGHDIEDLRNWGDIYTNNVLPVLQNAYDKCETTIVIPCGNHRMTPTMGMDDALQRETLMCLQARKKDKTLIFSDGAALIVNPITDPLNDGRYYAIYVSSGHNNTIVKPKIFGERDGHTGTDGEHGFGIYNYNSSNLTIVAPECNDFWGDGIYWNVSDINVYGGHIVGTGTYKRNRRQGISIISCNGLTIDRSVGMDISGAPNGPFATIDVEPNRASQFIIDLKIGDVVGIRNAGPAFLCAPIQLDGTTRPVDITVGSVHALGCFRGVEFRSDKDVKGVVKIGNILGRDSSTQEMQSIMWADTLRLEIDSITSIDCNRSGNTSSPNAVAVRLSRNQAGPVPMGGITIRHLDCINPNTTLAHPVSFINQQGGAISGVEIESITYDPSRMTFGGRLHSPAGNYIKTKADIYIYPTAPSSTLSNATWCNRISNRDATVNLGVTVPAGYGYIGMVMEILDASTYQINITFMDGLAGFPSGAVVRSRTNGSKLTVVREAVGWQVLEATAGDWQINSTTIIGAGNTAGGTTSSRPSNPLPWQLYFDTTLGYDVRWRADTLTWVKASGT